MVGGNWRSEKADVKLRSGDSRAAEKVLVRAGSSGVSR
jgi:hypothetical protein